MSSLTGRMTRALDAWDDKRFERLTAILIAIVTVVAAVAAYLQTDASAEASRASRDAQQYALQALGTRVAGQAEVDFGRRAVFHAWQSLETGADSAEKAGDFTSAARLRAVRDSVAPLSPALDAPYFEREAEWVDEAALQADRYIAVGDVLSERYQLASRRNNAWSDKANLYVANLTMFAVALSLYGLATTLDGRARWLFLGVGSTIVTLTSLWMIDVYRRPVPHIPEAALQSYGEGTGSYWRGDTDGAIEAFSRAIEAAPQYTGALYQRGLAYLTRAEENDHAADVSRDLRAAVDDFRAARFFGQDDLYLGWNLGWAYYLLGDYDRSIETSVRTLARYPDLYAVHCNIGLAQLAAGDIAAAHRSYEEAERQAIGIVEQRRRDGRQPPSSLWHYLDACASDLDGLLARSDGEPKAWLSAPPRDLIDAGPEAHDEAEHWRDRFRSLNVALEFGGDTLVPPSGVQVSDVQFMTVETDESGENLYGDPAESFEFGINRLAMVYDYRGFRDGQRWMHRVFRDGVEELRLRSSGEWSLGGDGQAIYTFNYAYSSLFVLPSGEYTVEIYIDDHLAQRGSFTITQE